MKAIIANFIAATGLMLAGGVMAVDMPDLAKKYGCSNCHMIEKNFVGPAWKDVAAKYKGEPDAMVVLGAKIVNGGSGSWGTIPMPPIPEISEPEVKELVTFILGL